MNNEQRTTDLQAMLEGDEVLNVLKVESVNHKPHLFMIGPRHVRFASDHFGGMLNEQALEAAEKAGIMCAAPGCNLGYKKHTSDRVMFISLQRHATNKEVQDSLAKASDYMVTNDIDGVTFVETEEKFRVTE